MRLRALTAPRTIRWAMGVLNDRTIVLFAAD
jgi:hypothetical protein